MRRTARNAGRPPRWFFRRGRFALLILAAHIVPASPGRAATFDILSASRIVWAAVYATDDLTEVTESDSVAALHVFPFDEHVAVDLAHGTNTLSGVAEQTSSFTPAVFQAAGAHDAFAENPGTAGFGVASGLSRCEIEFRIETADAYMLTGFLEAFELGWTSMTLTGPGGSVHDVLVGGQHVPLAVSGALAAGDYTLIVATSGSAHGWPPFPSASSGAFEVTLALGGATAVPRNDGRTARPALAAFPNPFRHATRILFAEGAAAPLCIYDAGGRLVRTLQSRGHEGAAGGAVEWDGRDEEGRVTPAGVYFVSVGIERSFGREPAQARDSARIVRVR